MRPIELDNECVSLLLFGPDPGFRARTSHLYVPAPRGLSRDQAHALRERGWIREAKVSGQQTLVVLTEAGERQLDRLLAVSARPSEGK